MFHESLLLGFVILALLIILASLYTRNFLIKSSLTKVGGKGNLQKTGFGYELYWWKKYWIYGVSIIIFFVLFFIIGLLYIGINIAAFWGIFFLFLGFFYYYSNKKQFPFFTEQWTYTYLKEKGSDKKARGHMDKLASIFFIVGILFLLYHFTINPDLTFILK